MKTIASSIRSLFSIALFAMTFTTAACGPNSIRDKSADAGTATDASPGHSCSPACSGNDICSNGQCVALPSSCPCPLDSYCDLSSNSCVAGCSIDSNCESGDICDGTSCRVGCRADGDCSGGKICDASSESCRAGCRADIDCSNSQYCNTTASTCETGCRGDDSSTCGNDAFCSNNVCIHDEGSACADDGNPCTNDVYDGNNNCTHEAVDDFTSCTDDGSSCTDDVCQSGTCQHIPAEAGTACDDDGNECSNDVCNSTGTCTHDGYPTPAYCGPSAGADSGADVTDYSHKCNGPVCAVYTASCIVINDTEYAQYFDPNLDSSVANNCGCNGNGELSYDSADEEDDGGSFSCSSCTGTPTEAGNEAICWQ